MIASFEIDFVRTKHQVIKFGEENLKSIITTHVELFRALTSHKNKIGLDKFNV